MTTRTCRTLALGAVAAVGCLALAACGGGAPGGGGAPPPAKPAQPLRIAAVIKGLDNQFFQAMQKGIEDASAGGGVSTTVQAAASITDTTGQTDKLTGLAGQDYGCYVVNPITGTNLVQGIAQVSATGKPVVNIDRPVAPEAAEAAGLKIATYIGTDNLAAGRMAAAEITRLLPAGGKVAVVGGVTGDVTSGERIQGLISGLGPGIVVAQSVAANWERQEALTQATNVLTANPDLAAFFVANDDMGLGVARAVANAGKTAQVRVISVDGNPDALRAVKAGELTATVAQYPYAIGEMGVQACRAAAAGASLPAKVNAPILLITKDNADQAIAAAPRPLGDYPNPFPALIGK